MFLQNGDSILIESPAYVGILAHLRPYNLNFVEINIDADGLIADEMERILNEWPVNKKKPKVIYFKF
jgi:kynurenine/2-aminoadipate aminotransferase